MKFFNVKAVMFGWKVFHGSVTSVLKEFLEIHNEHLVVGHNYKVWE